MTDKVVSAKIQDWWKQQEEAGGRSAGTREFGRSSYPLGKLERPLVLGMRCRGSLY